jgi:hypothetical protein
VKKIVIVASIVTILVLASIFYIVFSFSSDRSPMTMTEFVDTARDTNDDGLPDNYVGFEPGDSVLIHDEIVDVSYHSWVYYDEWRLFFSYEGKRWKEYYEDSGGISVYIWGNISLCSYGLGDWITLNGTVLLMAWGGHTYEYIDWNIAEETEPMDPPSIEVNLTQTSPMGVRVDITGCNNTCKLMHWDAVLKKYTLPWDWLYVLEHGKQSLYMEFWDMDSDGCLSTGDIIYANVEEEGDYELVILFHDTELASVSWTSGP